MRIAPLALALLVGCANPFAVPSCADGVDNDGDGLSDLADPDCAGDGQSDAEAIGGMDAGADAGGLDAAVDAGPPDASFDAGREVDAGPDASPDGGAPDAGPPCALGPAADHVCDAQRRPFVCGGSCVDLENDPAHCGGCDAPCGMGDVCIHGNCSRCNRIGGDTICGGRCSRTDVDAAGCGGCGGPTCTGNQRCVGGLCRPPMSGGRCTNPFSLAEGTQNVPLFAGAWLDAVRPRCMAPNAEIRRATILEITAPRAGLHTVIARAAGVPLAATLLEGAGCRCPAPLGDGCDAATGTVSVSETLAAGESRRVVVTSGTVAVTELAIELQVN